MVLKRYASIIIIYKLYIKVLTESNIDRFIDDSEFQPRRAYPILQVDANIENLHLMKLCSDETSVHNQVFSNFCFRLCLHEHFQTRIHNNRGVDSPKGNFTIDYVTPSAAYSLFSFVADRFASEKIPINFEKVKDKNVKKDLMFNIANSDGDNLHIAKMDNFIDSEQSIVLKIPFPDFLFGYLPSHYNKYPEKVDMTRTLTPSLKSIKFDYISEEIKIEYNAQLQTLAVSFNLKQDYNEVILSKHKPFNEQLKFFLDNLPNRTFFDGLYNWSVTVVMVSCFHLNANFL